MLPFFKRILCLKIRKQRRFRLMEGVFVSYENSILKSPVTDISLGGLSFYYVADRIVINKGAEELSVFTDGHIRVGEIPFRPVSDVETGKLLLRDKKFKRQSVHFGNLTSLQKAQLRKIIRIYRS